MAPKSSDKGSKKLNAEGKEVEKMKKAKKRKGDETLKPRVKKFKNIRGQDKIQTNHKETKRDKQHKEREQKQSFKMKRKGHDDGEKKSRKRKFTDGNKKLQSSVKKFREDGKSDEQDDKPNLWQMKKKDRKLLRKKQSNNYDLVLELKQIYEKVRRKHCSREEREKLINQVLELISGHTHDVVFKHDTNRVIQSCIKYGTNEQRSKLFDQFKGDLDELLKSRYAKFFVKKMLKYGSKKQREVIVKSFHGKVRKLIRHKDASDIMETIYSEYATASQKITLVQEFYGADFALFKGESGYSLKKILESEPHRKTSIVKYMKEALTPLVDRSVITHSIVHRVLLEFFTHADEKSRGEMIEAIRECVVLILHTHDGARVAMHCLWFGTAKDRKVIVKSFKKYVTKICKEEYGHLVMLALFDVIDDTVLVKKVLFPEIVSSLKELALDSYGRKVLLYLLCPRVAYYFHPSVTTLLHMGDGNPTSKKAPELRRKELLEAISADLIQLVIDESGEFVMDKGACQLVQAVLMKCPGDVTPAMKEIVDLANKGLDPFSPGEDHIIKSSVGHFTLKRLIQQDKERIQSDKTEHPVYFSKLLLENQDPGTLFEWCKVNRGAFVVASLLESPVPGISEEVTSQLKPHSSKLKKYESAGVEVVIKLLES